jgi:hypothetical protein
MLINLLIGEALPLFSPACFLSFSFELCVSFVSLFLRVQWRFPLGPISLLLAFANQR